MDGPGARSSQRGVDCTGLLIGGANFSSSKRAEPRRPRGPGRADCAQGSPSAREFRPGSSGRCDLGIWDAKGPVPSPSLGSSLLTRGKWPNTLRAFLPFLCLSLPYVRGAEGGWDIACKLPIIQHDTKYVVFETGILLCKRIDRTTAGTTVILLSRTHGPRR